jgi:acyl carrier protein
MRGDIAQRVKQALVRGLQLKVNPEDIADDESLFGEGLDADSIAALEIVFALEEEFGFEVEDEDLRVDLFDSVSTLASYIEERLAVQSPMS